MNRQPERQTAELPRRRPQPWGQPRAGTPWQATRTGGSSPCSTGAVASRGSRRGGAFARPPSCVWARGAVPSGQLGYNSVTVLVPAAVTSHINHLL